METQRAQSAGKTWAFTSECHENPWKDCEQRRSVFFHACSRITLTAVLKKFCKGLPSTCHSSCIALLQHRGVEGHQVGSCCGEK